MIQLIIVDTLFTNINDSDVKYCTHSVVGLANDIDNALTQMNEIIEKKKIELTKDESWRNTRTKTVSERKLSETSFELKQEIRSPDKDDNIDHTINYSIRDICMDDLNKFFYKNLPCVDILKEFISKYGFENDLKSLETTTKDIHKEDLWPLLFLHFEYPDNWRQIFKDNLLNLKSKIHVWGKSNFYYSKYENMDDESCYTQLFLSNEEGNSSFKRTSSNIATGSDYNDPMNEFNNNQSTFYPNGGSCVLTVELELLNVHNTNILFILDNLKKCPLEEIESILSKVGLENLILRAKKIKLGTIILRNIFTKTLIKLLRFNVEFAKKTLETQINQLNILYDGLSNKEIKKRKRDIDNDCDNINIKLIKAVQKNFRDPPSNAIVVAVLKKFNMDAVIAREYLSDLVDETGFWEE